MLCERIAEETKIMGYRKYLVQSLRELFSSKGGETKYVFFFFVGDEGEKN